MENQNHKSKLQEFFFSNIKKYYAFKALKKMKSIIKQNSEQIKISEKSVIKYIKL